jgi:hypothetical protein
METEKRIYPSDINVLVEFMSKQLVGVALRGSGVVCLSEASNMVDQCSAYCIAVKAKLDTLRNKFQYVRDLADLDWLECSIIQLDNLSTNASHIENSITILDEDWCSSTVHQRHAREAFLKVTNFHIGTLQTLEGIYDDAIKVWSLALEGSITY